MKIEDYVGGSQSVSDNQTVMSCDDDEFKIKERLRDTVRPAATRRLPQKVSIRSETRFLRVAQCCSAYAG